MKLYQPTQEQIKLANLAVHLKLCHSVRPRHERLMRAVLNLHVIRVVTFSNNYAKPSVKRNGFTPNGFPIKCKYINGNGNGDYYWLYLDKEAALTDCKRVGNGVILTGWTYEITMTCKELKELIEFAFPNDDLKGMEEVATLL